MTCGRCLVKVISGKTSPLNEAEQSILGAKNAAAGFRLACAARVQGHVTVEVPVQSLAAVQRLALGGREPDFDVDPTVTAYPLRLSEPSLNHPLTDWENVCQALEWVHGLQNLEPDPAMLRVLPSVLRSSGWEISAIVRKNEVIDARPHNGGLLGLALDIGTTKIAALLIDLPTGRTLAAQGTLNPQVAYGEDVMSRLSYAIKGHGEKLREDLVGAINRLIAES